MEELTDISRPRSGPDNPFGNDPATTEWWNRWGGRAEQIYARRRSSLVPLPYYDFDGQGRNALSSHAQMGVLYDLTHATEKDYGRSLILDWGTRRSLSAYQTSQAFGETTVVSIDPVSPPAVFDENELLYSHASFSPEPNGSFVAHFSVNGFNIDPRRLRTKFDRTHIFAPTPEQIAIQTLKAYQLSHQTVVVMDPSISLDPSLLENQINRLPKDVQRDLKRAMLTLDQIESLTGASHSLYLEGFPRDFRVPTLILDKT